MVLWEITLGTAYFLGLKRTYRLALRIQSRIKHPKIRQFLQRRTRAVFDVALKVHKNIQQRDLEVGRSIGNRILRWLDRMKPSAQIRGLHEKPQHGASANTNLTKQLTNTNTNTSHLKNSGSTTTARNNESNRHLFIAPTSMWPNSFPTIAKMMRPTKPAGTMTQYRHLYISRPDASRLSYARGGFEGFIRKDIMQWMLQN